MNDYYAALTEHRARIQLAEQRALRMAGFTPRRSRLARFFRPEVRPLDSDVVITSPAVTPASQAA